MKFNQPTYVFGVVSVFMLALGVVIYTGTRATKQGSTSGFEANSEADNLHKSVINLFLQAEYAPTSPQFCRVSAFNSVHKLQNRLVALGTGTIRKWRTSHNEWIYTADYREIGPPGPEGLPTNLVLFLESPSPDYIQALTIKVNLNNRAEKWQALQMYSDVAEKVFAVIGLPVPQGLKEAMQTGKPFDDTNQQRLIKNSFDSGNVDAWTLRITSH
jgi:hypothetical protein